jgi:hypothetical protein
METPDTPRTDEILIQCPSHLQEVALANLCMELERENARLREINKLISDQLAAFINK